MSMSDENPNDKKLINFIATTVETMRDQMVTKMVTKDELGRIEKMVEYTGGQVEALRHQVGTIRDEMATKNGLAALETVMRGDFEQVHMRFDTRTGNLDQARPDRGGSQPAAQRGLSLGEGQA